HQSRPAHGRNGAILFTAFHAGLRAHQSGDRVRAGSRAARWSRGGHHGHRGRSRRPCRVDPHAAAGGGNEVNILFIGDIFGRPGRDALMKALPILRRKYETDFIIVNGENSANGKGITSKIAEEFLHAGVDVISGGNHSLHQKDADELHESEQRILRPENYPPGTVGRGWGIYNSSAGFPVGVINICGRTFMGNFDHPYRTVSRVVERIRETTPIIIVDFHAEATSEKVAMGWYLDGRV